MFQFDSYDSKKEIFPSKNLCHCEKTVILGAIYVKHMDQ